MDSKKELEKLLDRNTSLIDKLHNCLINGGVEIPKEVESELKKLKLCGVGVTVPKGTLGCDCPFTDHCIYQKDKCEAPIEYGCGYKQPNAL